MSKISKTLVVLNCNDPKLPPSSKLIGAPPSSKELDSLEWIQIEPIGLVKSGKEYIVLYGRRRLRKIRELLEAGRHDDNGAIDCYIWTGVDPSDHSTIALLENADRSKNKVDTYVQIKAELKRKVPSGEPAPTYSSIAKLCGMTVGEIKAIEKDWFKVPTWAINAVQRGDIAPATAVEVGKLKTVALQDKCKDILHDKGKLSTATVKEERKFVATAQYATMVSSGGLGISSALPGLTEYFSRKELLNIYVELEKGYVNDVLAHIETLLGLPIKKRS